jgi:hypothetical protein
MDSFAEKSTEKSIRQCRHDTSAIAIARIGTDSSTVSHVAEDVTGIGERRVRRYTAAMDNEAHTARVLFEAWVIETLGGREARHGQMFLCISLIWVKKRKR